MPNSVSILLPTHNRSPILARTLDSLAQIQIPPDTQVELIVVANACTDDTLTIVSEKAKSLPFPARCVEEPAPGLNVARNRAVQESTGQLILFLDDDVRLENTWLTGYLEVFNRYPADIVAGKITLWWDAVPRPDWLGESIDFLLSHSDQGPQIIPLPNADHVVGANFGFRKTVYDMIGPFKMGLDRSGKSMLSGGETEFVTRALSQYFKVYYAPNAHVHHWVAPARATPEYLCRAAFGFGASYIYMKPSFGPIQFLRSTLGNLYLAARHRLCESLAARKNNTKTMMFHRVTRHRRLGAFHAAFQRGLGRSPLN